MAVKRIRQVYVVAEDVEATAAFYSDVLGLELQFRDGERWVQYGGGEISVAVASVDEGGGASVGSTVAVYEVDDLDAQVISATSAGVMLVAHREMGEHGRMATFRDPSGALIALMQRAA